MIYHHAKANPLNVFGQEFHLYIMTESNDQHTSLRMLLYRWSLYHFYFRCSLASSYKVVVGEHDRRINEGTEVTVSVRRIISHPNYNRPSRLNNDIALIQLASRVRLSARVNPVCLPSNAIAIPTGSRCYITGNCRIDVISSLVRVEIEDILAIAVTIVDKPWMMQLKEGWGGYSYYPHPSHTVMTV